MKKALLAAAFVIGSLWAIEGPSLAQLTQARPDQANERRICRMMQVTGKLAAGRRVCLTKAEWDRAGEENRRVAGMMMNAVDSCASGGRIGLGAPKSGQADLASSTTC